MTLLVLRAGAGVHSTSVGLLFVVRVECSQPLPATQAPPSDAADRMPGMAGSKRVHAALRAIEKAGGLVTPSEIADEWGVSPAAVSKRIVRGQFPEPVKTAGRVRLYLRDQVEPYRPS
jgi:hypothetical protein